MQWSQSWFSLLFALVAASATQSAHLDLLYEQAFDSLNHSARARIYPAFAPDLLFITARNGGLSVFNISSPIPPRLVGTVSSASRCLEGQDLNGNKLLLVDVCASALLLVLLEQPIEGELHVEWSIPLWPMSGALHVRWLPAEHMAVVSNPGSSPRCMCITAARLDSLT